MDFHERATAKKIGEKTQAVKSVIMQTLVLLANPLNTDLAGAVVRLVRQLRERAAARSFGVFGETRFLTKR